MKNFDEKWKKAKFLWKIDWDNKIIQKFINDKRRSTYEDILYGTKLFFNLTSAKRHIKIIGGVSTPDGHYHSTPKVEEFKIIKNLLK